MVANRRVWLSILLLVAGWSGNLAHAQCTDFPPRSMSCASNGCFDSYSPALPAGGSMVTDDTIAIKCCNHIVMAFNGGDRCPAHDLTAADRRRVFDLIEVSGAKMMVKDCHGHFRALSLPRRDPLEDFKNTSMRFDLTPKG